MVARHGWWVLVFLTVISCGGSGGGGGSQDPGSIPPPVSDPAQQVAVHGTVSFDLVPIVGNGLYYLGTKQAPARGITLEAVGDSGAILASTVTDDEGHYSFELPVSTSIVVRALAEMRRSANPEWNVRVVDNTESDSLFVLDGPRLSTGTTDQTRDLHAASGWDGSAYSQERAAAPFAILSVVHDALNFVATAVPTSSFPALSIHWSTKNVPNFAANGQADPQTGEIGSSYYDDTGIYLLGAADSDTDEYDPHVIDHELGHYLAHSFWRSDGIGGSHAMGDQLDLRVSFSEGWADAFSAMATSDALYADTLGPGQQLDYVFDIEDRSSEFPYWSDPRAGWFNEASIHLVLYDLFDSHQDTAEDSVALGFPPIFNALVNHVKSTPRLHEHFSVHCRAQGGFAG